MKRRRILSAEPPAEADVRPTLLGVVTLLFLLLFFLLATSSGQKLGVIGLRFGSAADLAPLPHAGLLQRVEITVDGSAAVVRADVQTTDIAASATSVERRTIPVGARPDGSLDLAALEAALTALHDLDPTQERAVVAPSDAVTTETLVAVLDVARGPKGAARFPQVALAGVDQTSTPAVPTPPSAP